MDYTFNKRASFDYEVLEKLDAGVVLTGPEVKSIKRGQIDLSGSYINIDQNQIPWLTNAKISPYPPARSAQQSYDPTRPRKILLKKKEILKIIAQRTGGLTIVPLRVYNKGGLIKIEIAMSRGKKKFDKRESIKKRDVNRKIQQAFQKMF